MVFDAHGQPLGRASVRQNARDGVYLRIRLGSQDVFLFPDVSSSRSSFNTNANRTILFVRQWNDFQSTTNAAPHQYPTPIAAQTTGTSPVHLSPEESLRQAIDDMYANSRVQENIGRGEFVVAASKYEGFFQTLDVQSYANDPVCMYYLAVLHREIGLCVLCAFLARVQKAHRVVVCAFSSTLVLRGEGLHQGQPPCFAWNGHVQQDWSRIF